MMDPSSPVNYSDLDPLGRGPYNGPIPRVKKIKASKERTHSFQTSDGSNIDTFGENALETIYDQFRFLEDSEVPSPCSSGRAILDVCKKKPLVAKQSVTSIIFCLIGFIQLASSITFIVLASVRLWEQFQTDPKNISPANEQQLDSTQSILKSISYRSGLSVIIPSMFQILSALCICWTFLHKRRLKLQILQIIFSFISIISWYDSYELVALELNLRLGHPIEHKSRYYGTYIVLSIVAYFETLVLPICCIIMLCHQMMRNCQHRKNLLTVGLTIATSLLSAVIVFFSAFAVNKSINSIDNYNPIIPFYGFGMREIVVAIHILICSLFFFFSSLYGDCGLALAVILMQIQLVITLVVDIFDADRLSMILWTLKPSNNNNSSVFHLNIILLYTFFTILLFILTLQIVINIRNLKFPVRRKSLNV